MIKKAKKNFLLLTLIIFFAFIIRIYHTANYPPLLWDESALGYNAYSILKTAKDEYGHFLPLIFKSFGDYKPGLYIYLTVPFVAIFGLNPLAIRLPSIVLGSLLPLLTYFLILTIDKKQKKLAIVSALVLTFNPYNIHYSRGAWETNLFLFILILSTYFFFKKKYFLSAVSFGLSLYSYQSAKMISLFMLFILFFLNKKTLTQQLKKLSLSFIIPLTILPLPLIYGLIFKSDTNRLKVLSLFSYPQNSAEKQQIISESNSFDYRLFYNQTISFFNNFLTRYFNHLSPKFLFSQGDWQNPRHSAPYIGVLLYPSILFLFIGLFTSDYKQKLNLFFLIFLLLAPIPASLTRDMIQATRSLPISIPLVFFISQGIIFVINKTKLKTAVSRTIVLIYLISFAYYADLYLNHMVLKSPSDWLYGYQQANQYLIKHRKEYRNIYMTDFYGQPYIYYLFYSQYPPQQYQQQANLIENSNQDTGKITKIDKIHFSVPNLNSIENKTSTLAIYSYDQILRQGINKSENFKKFIPISPL
ncbi:hypothetical protein DRH14_01975, partial [Candidatus Shapirobacteria bacterium]